MEYITRKLHRVDISEIYIFKNNNIYINTLRTLYILNKEDRSFFKRSTYLTLDSRSEPPFRIVRACSKCNLRTLTKGKFAKQYIAISGGALRPLHLVIQPTYITCSSFTVS